MAVMGLAEGDARRLVDWFSDVCLCRRLWQAKRLLFGSLLRGFLSLKVVWDISMLEIRM
jgi:hypothetical protein